MFCSRSDDPSSVTQVTLRNRWHTMQLSTRQFGQQAEKEACEFLVSQGLKFEEANFECKAGEIDLIMWDDETLVFVEVRFRKKMGYGDGADSVTLTKQRRIIRSALLYLQKHDLMDEHPCRFDVIAAAPGCREATSRDDSNAVRSVPASQASGGQEMVWIKDAFQVQYA